MVDHALDNIDRYQTKICKQVFPPRFRRCMAHFEVTASLCTCSVVKSEVFHAEFSLGKVRTGDSYPLIFAVRVFRHFSWDAANWFGKIVRAVHFVRTVVTVSSAWGRSLSASKYGRPDAWSFKAVLAFNMGVKSLRTTVFSIYTEICGNVI